MKFRSCAVGLAASALSLAGCAPAGRVTGDLGGEPVPTLTHGLWVRFDVTETPRLLLFVTDIPHVCDVYTAYADQEAEAFDQYMSDGDVAALEDGLNQAEQDNLPEEYWSAEVVVAATPTTAVGDYAAGDPFADESGFAVAHVTGYTDWSGFVSGDSGVTTPGDYYISQSGTTTVDSLVEDGAMEAHGDAEMADQDAAAAGSVSWTLSGDWCEGYEAAFTGA